MTPRLEHLWQLVTQRMSGCDLAHDAEHVARVTRWCSCLAAEAGADPELATAAGMVHDLVAIPKDHPDRPMGGEWSAQAADGLLTTAGFTTVESTAIVEAVRTCSWSRGLRPTGPLGQVLQDADRLDAIGMIGLARMIATAQDMATRSPGALYAPDQPWPTTRPADDRRYALDHVVVKLRHLAAGMWTPRAQREAARRQQAMEQAVASLLQDIHDPAAQTEDAPLPAGGDS